MRENEKSEEREAYFKIMVVRSGTYWMKLESNCKKDGKMKFVMLRIKWS